MSSHQESKTYDGECLCGAVQVQLRLDTATMSACHCGICRRWGGGPSMTVETHEAPVITGAEHVKTFSSSEWAERGFCGNCGTHLFYRLKKGSFYSLSVGLFEQASSWPFTLQVFVDDKPGNYDFANATKRMTGEDVFKAWPE